MIPEDKIDLLVERLVQRINKANIYFLKNIGSSVKKIGKLTPTQAHQLIQILKYGSNYDEITKKIAKYTNLSIEDIDNIFESYAKADQRFYRKFYAYRDIPYIPYQENRLLRMQTLSLANMTKGELYKSFSLNVLGYSIRDNKGNLIFRGLRDTYNYVLDEALLNISQGKTTFDNAMYRILNDLGGSGLKTIDYASGRIIRLDSAIRMHLNDRLRTLHNENAKLYGEEFGYNGIEVTHHLNAAPDHIDTIDGKQFALIDKIKWQINNDIEHNIKLEDISRNRVKVKGKWYDDYNYVNDSLDRHVSTLNCRHKIFPIIVGVSKPEYTAEELERDKERNNEGCIIDNKHYTLYEASQLQRALERKIREQKDKQILGRESDNKKLIDKSQQKITLLTRKYREVSKLSELPTRPERLRVSNYKRVEIN